MSRAATPPRRPSSDRLRSFQRIVLEWHSKHRRDLPWRTTQDAFEVLVAEVLLQRTVGSNVAPVYREVLRRWPTPDRLGRAHLATIRRVISPLGLTRRATVLRQLGKALAAAGGVPTEPDELLKLPGVGPYTANAVAVFARGADLPLVDWVIARVLRRFFGLSGTRRPNDDTELWALATQLAQAGEARNTWLGILDLSSMVCARTPRCDECPLKASCFHHSMARGPAEDERPATSGRK